MAETTAPDLEAAITRRFRHLLTPALIRRMKAAPVFSCDDEEVEQ